MKMLSQKIFILPFLSQQKIKLNEFLINLFQKCPTYILPNQMFHHYQYLDFVSKSFLRWNSRVEGTNWEKRRQKMLSVDREPHCSSEENSRNDCTLQRVACRVSRTIELSSRVRARHFNSEEIAKMPPRMATNKNKNEEQETEMGQNSCTLATAFYCECVDGEN